MSAPTTAAEARLKAVSLLTAAVNIDPDGEPFTGTAATLTESLSSLSLAVHVPDNLTAEDAARTAGQQILAQVEPAMTAIVATLVEAYRRLYHTQEPADLCLQAFAADIAARAWPPAQE